MRIVCPHAGPPYPETLLSLEASGYEVEYRDTSASDTAYAELVMELWKHGEGFAIVEADMAFPPEALQRLVECENDYCAGIYPWSTQLGPALGFTKFGTSLLNNVNVPNLGGTHYRQTDIAVLRLQLGRRHQRQPHLHLPPIRHLNPKQALRPEFQHLTLAEHLDALGYEIAEDGLTAEYVRPTREFGELPVRA